MNYLRNEAEIWKFERNTINFIGIIICKILFFYRKNILRLSCVYLHIKKIIRTIFLENLKCK